MNNDTGAPFPSQPLNTAVLFVIFNRLDTAKQVLDAIRQVKPTKLYIVSDAARKEKKDEKELVSSIREYVLDNIDWKCEVKTDFRIDNAGCGLSMKSAIDWFFAHEDEGIILEDDVVPVQSFFHYCEELLTRYRDDTRIGMISGNNHYKSSLNDSSYFFSKNKGCWGWATWKRAWKNMNYEMKWLNSDQKQSILQNMGYSERSIKYWENNIRHIQKDNVSAWDWQWYFSLASQNQLCIVPNNNLVSNMGFGVDATHTSGTPKEVYLSVEELTFPLRHPSYIVPNSGYDKKVEEVKAKFYLLQLAKSFLPVKLKKNIKLLGRGMWKK